MANSCVTEGSWLLLTYKVPPEPARHRLAVWRKLKGLGAVYLQGGVCVLPRTDELRRRLKMIENDIAEAGGECVLLQTVGLDPGQEAKLLARFDDERDADYREVIERCGDFEAEIAKETAAGKLTYAELEENDEDLRKLRRWLAKVRRLDFHGAPLAASADAALARCEALLERFSQQVFEAQAENASPAPSKKPATGEEE